jgi:hypothetical protein
MIGHEIVVACLSCYTVIILYIIDVFVACLTLTHGNFVCNNYAGIALLSHCLKVYEKIMNLQLRRQVENQMREEQYGFRDNG